jgi:branched-subunit amino acid aminotransferase/4-amino-4-deoxychorismate lyase
MVIYSLKKSYQLKDLREVDFKDLWGDHGIFTTMWIFGKPPKILFFENHIKNLIKSLKIYGIKKKFLRKDILKIINENLSKKVNYNHLLRVALNKKIISISLRKRVSPKLNFDLKLVNLKREKPQYKNLKYKKILRHLMRMDNSKSDIGLVYKKKILETGTSNLFL